MAARPKSDKTRTRSSSEFEAVRQRDLLIYEMAYGGNPPVRVGKRDHATARRAAMRWADQWLPLNAIQLWKEPKALLRSFERKLDSSRTVRDLFNDSRITRHVISQLLSELIMCYDDRAVPQLPAHRALSLAEHPLPTREVRKRAKAFELAASAIRESVAVREERSGPDAFTLQDKAIAESLESFAHLNRKALRGPRLLRQARDAVDGRDRTLVGDLIHNLDLILDPIDDPPERRQWIASLVSDFFDTVGDEQIRGLLKDRRHRASIRRGSGRKKVVE